MIFGLQERLWDTIYNRLGRAISKFCSSTTEQQSAVRVLSIPAIHYLYISRLDC